MLFYQDCDRHHLSLISRLPSPFLSVRVFLSLVVAVTEQQHPLLGKNLPTERCLCLDFSQRTHEAYFVATYGQGGMHSFL